MRAYPTSKEMPKRKQRKALRKRIFEENKLGDGARRRRSDARSGRIPQ